MSVREALSYARKHRQRFVSELQEFIRFPSISAQPSHADDLKHCADWLASHLRRLGLADARVVPTQRHPVVYATWRKASGRPTVLVYGHYDVQPVDPLRAWHFPPFNAIVRGDNLYGRGACDDKGQMFVHLKALEAYLATSRALPVNIKCLFEGEEEIGSPNLPALIQRNRAELAADVAIVSDTRMLAPGQPALNYAERGALYLELEVSGPGNDLHSGNFGGVVHNPLQALCEILASLHHRDGRIAISGIYDNVRSWSSAERAFMARSGPSDRQLLRQATVEQGWGEPGFSSYERLTLRPALTLNGIKGGYQGPGAKGVIPASATAKLSFRLVPDQTPAEIEQLFRAHIARVTPRNVRSKVSALSGAKPVLISRHHPAVHAASWAYQKGFGALPTFLRSGGTIPILDTFQQVLEIPTVLMGFALPDDRIHAPNEKFHLPNFFRGIETSIWFMAAMGAPRARLAA
jgi:acetylornithine deacetylase/succinyl-diaminopimelate desuccinylase-like protein